jgi:hypothetical protein
MGLYQFEFVRLLLRGAPEKESETTTTNLFFYPIPIHTHLRLAPRLANTTSHIFLLISHTRACTSTRSIGFYVMWVCVGSSSSSKVESTVLHVSAPRMSFESRAKTGLCEKKMAGWLGGCVCATTPVDLCVCLVTDIDAPLIFYWCSSSCL